MSQSHYAAQAEQCNAEAARIARRRLKHVNEAGGNAAYVAFLTQIASAFTGLSVANQAIAQAKSALHQVGDEALIAEGQDLCEALCGLMGDVGESPSDIIFRSHEDLAKNSIDENALTNGVDTDEDDGGGQAA